MPCTYPGCAELSVSRSRCNKHQVRVDRDVMRHRLYDRRWQAFRRSYLADNPWCVVCIKLGRYVAATDVHHIERHCGDKNKFIAGPFMALCHACHSAITAKEVGWITPHQ